MLKKLRSLFRSGVEVEAAAQLPPVQPPKNPPRAQLSIPSYLTTAKPSEAAVLPLNDRRLANKDLLDYRTGTDTRSIIRDFAVASPDISAAVNAALRTGITDDWTAVAYNMDGTINVDGTRLCHQLIANFDALSNYPLGYADRNSLLSTSEALGREILLYGSCALELVLDKTRLPERLQPLSVTNISFYPTENGKRLRPVQKIGSEEIDLDIPTFFYVSVDQDVKEPYSSSPLEPALQAVLFSIDFMNDLRRVVKRAIHPRVDVAIDEEKFRKGIPPEVMYDPEKLQAHMAQVVSDLEARISGLKPEDALVHFDTIGVSIVEHRNSGISNEWDTLQSIANSRMATATKTMPTILGHGSASANIASAESMLYMKTADGVIRKKLNEIYSRVFTLAMRLCGLDVYVVFAYEDIDLRPKNEIEAFRAMKQSRILEQLSLGLISDEEACIALTGRLPPKGYKPLSGTGFRPNTAIQPAGNGYNGASNDGSALNQNLKSDAPTGGARGQNKKADAASVMLQ